MCDWSETLSFKELTDFLSKNAKVPKKSRFKNMEKFLLYCRKKANCYSKNPADEKLSLFPVMRILMPSLDKERGSYNMKESVIADLYIEFLQLGKTSADAVKLKNYKAPKVVQDDAGDFASVVYTVMLDRSYPGNKLSLFQVNQKLDEIVRATQTEGRRKVAEVLKYLFLNQSPQEQKWLLRIILKEMGMGIGTNSMFAAFHRDAKDLYEVNSNLRKVCEDLHDPNIRLNQIGIQIFDAFKPQLADRIQLANLETIMKDKSWYIETKYDGERMQAHYKDNKFKFFSRNGNDFTVEFGASGQEINKFSKFLASSLDLSKLKSIILDGEICAWHKDENRIVQKADKYDIRNIKADNQKYQQCLIIYDICYLNGKVLTALPLKERIDIYKGLINPQPGRIQFSERKIVTSAEEVVEALHKAIDDREEGLVLKDQSSVYKPGARANSGWIKLKPDYENGLMDTVDLVVLGGYYGSGRHSGNVAQFLLGLQDTSTNPARFKSFCRVANGFNDEERVDLVKKCGPGLRTGQPADVDVTKEKPDVWYNPVTAPVLQVNAAEMIYSSSYAVGSTLRFPRVEQIRTDKDSSSCTTLEEIQTIKLKGGGKLFGNKRIGDLQTLSQPKRARIADDNSSSRKAGGGSSKRIPVFVNQQPLLDLSQERIETHHLKNKVVVVEPGVDINIKHKLERIVAKHGGTVEQNSKAGRTHIYIETIGSIKSKNIANQGLIDVVKSDWLLACDTKFTDYGPHDTVFATQETLNSWEKRYDSYGDSYKDPASMNSLTSSLKFVSNSTQDINTDNTEELNELISDLSGYKYFLFKGLKFHLDFPKDKVNIERLLRIQIERFGGKIIEQDSSTFSHLVLLNSNQQILERYKAMRRKRLVQMGSIFHMITPDWVYKCIDEAKLVDPSDYTRCSSID